MNQSRKPLWKKSILHELSYSDVTEWLAEVGEDGDCYGYERGDSGYYNDYKELFDELSAGAYSLWESMQEVREYWGFGGFDDSENSVWDDIMVASLGPLRTVLGYDSNEYDYFHMVCSVEEDWAQEEAKKRLMRMKKETMINAFAKVFQIMMLFWDLKAAHDCLTAVVDELDFKVAVLQEKNSAIDKLYEDYTGRDSEEFKERFEELTRNLPQRMWVE